MTETPVPGPAGIRASDTERDAVMSELSSHFIAGRLDKDELDQRLAVAAAARTRGELDRLLADLPRPAPQQEPARRPAAIPVPLIATVLLTALVAALVAGAATSRHSYFVPWWLIPVWFLFLRRVWWGRRPRGAGPGSAGYSGTQSLVR
jgi:hypothetical protein